jgi:hypothetical protein
MRRVSVGSSEVVESDPNEEFQDQRSFFPVDFYIDYYYSIYIIKLLYYFNFIRYRFRTGSISAFVCVCGWRVLHTPCFPREYNTYFQ